jgi:hypothetical protein
MNKIITRVRKHGIAILRVGRSNLATGRRTKRGSIVFQAQNLVIHILKTHRTRVPLAITLFLVDTTICCCYRTNQTRLTMFLSPQQVLTFALDYANTKHDRWSETTKILEFHRHYGSSPLDIADIWYDLVHDGGRYLPDELQLKVKEKNEKGFRQYMAGHTFLWTYPKNSSLLSTATGLCERKCRGEHIWIWVERIAALKAKKIRWEDVNSADNLEVFAISTDGVDCKLREEKHAFLPRDNSACSHKMNSAAAKYEVVLSVQRAKCVHIAGPFKGGVSDLEMFRTGGLRDKLQKVNMPIRGFRRVKLNIADRGYNCKATHPEDAELFALPNAADSTELNRFKSRTRLRHETFNARLKCFSALSLPFRHGFAKHKFVFEAIVVIVQYQMDNGSPIYAV